MFVIVWCVVTHEDASLTVQLFWCRRELIKPAYGVFLTCSIAQVPRGGLWPSVPKYHVTMQCKHEPSASMQLVPASTTCTKHGLSWIYTCTYVPAHVASLFTVSSLRVIYMYTTSMHVMVSLALYMYQMPRLDWILALFLRSYAWQTIINF